MKICLKCNCKFEASNWTCPSCGYEPEKRAGFYILNPKIDEFGYPQESFKRLYELEASNFWFRARNRLIIWAVKKYFPHLRNFLEVGCGTGFVISGIRKGFPHISLTGSDISSVGLEFAVKRTENVNVLQFNASYIPFEKEFDVIGSFDVLEHIEDDEKVLKQMHKAISEGGGIILTVPQHQFLWSKKDEHACHLRRYSAKELKEKVASAGFNVIKTTSFVSLLFPVMFLSRLRQKTGNKKYQAQSEMMLPAFINFLFEKVLDLERFLIKIGVGLPFGGSLLLIARKVE